MNVATYQNQGTVTQVQWTAFFRSSGDGHWLAPQFFQVEIAGLVAQVGTLEHGGFLWGIYRNSGGNLTLLRNYGESPPTNLQDAMTAAYNALLAMIREKA